MPPTNETALTRYRILTSEDNGVNWRYVGWQEARNRDDALRKHFAHPPGSSMLAVAVSESGFRPMTVATKVTTSLAEQELMTAERLAEEPQKSEPTPGLFPVADAPDNVPQPQSLRA